MTQTPGLSDSQTQLGFFASPEAEGEAGARPARLAARLPSYIEGHRTRLRARFAKSGAESLPDYELLELLLFRSLPRQDVKPLAHRLIAEFGDFGRVLSAPLARLVAVEGVGAAVALELKLAEACGQRLSRAKVVARPLLSNWDALLDYCHSHMAHAEVEQVRLLFLDRKNALIADEPQVQGTVDHVPIYPREVVRRALALNASALIVVHNHPSGDPTPSEADIAMTFQIQEACRVFGITLHDHLVIGQSCETSFRSLGYL